MSVPNAPSGDVQKSAPGTTRDELLALSKSASRRGAEKVDEIFKKAIASKLLPGGRP
jgi:hypothetical protein